MTKSLIPALVAIVASLLGLAGCSCDSSIHFSVIVNVVDASGAPINDATVTYSVDGDPAVSCGAATNSNQHICGSEIEGDFTITVTRGSEKKTQELSVDANYCHVETQSITMKLGA